MVGERWAIDRKRKGEGRQSSERREGEETKQSDRETRIFVIVYLNWQIFKRMVHVSISIHHSIYAPSHASPPSADRLTHRPSLFSHSFSRRSVPLAKSTSRPTVRPLLLSLFFLPSNLTTGTTLQIRGLGPGPSLPSWGDARRREGVAQTGTEEGEGIELGCTAPARHYTTNEDNSVKAKG